MTRGEIWAAIRDKLPGLRDQMRRAVEADRYLVESAGFDSIARKLADAVADRIEPNKEPWPDGEKT